MKLTLLAAMAALTSGLFASAGFASDVKDNWVVTEWAKGIPKTAVYSDSNMRIKLIADRTLPREGGGWRVVFLKAEIYSSQNLLEKTSGGQKGSFDILGYRNSSWSEDVQKIGSRKLVVTNFPIDSIWCGAPKFIQYSTSMGATHVLFPIQEMESREFHKLIDQWRVLPTGITCEQQYEEYLQRMRE